MSDAPDLEALARRYLDLWQDQMAAMANDPAVVEALSRTFALMTQGAAAFAQGADDDVRASAGGAFAGGESNHADPDGSAPSSRRAGHDGGAGSGPAERSGDPSPGAASVGAAPGDTGVDVSQLLRRLDALERRVAELDARLDNAAHAGRS